MNKEPNTELPSWLEWISLGDTVSTSNDVLKYTDCPKEIVMVTAEHQSAGRGQKGNSWESEKGKNLLFSLLLHPSYVPASQMFILSQAISLSIQQSLLTIAKEGIRIKWPNDIYWHDQKLCGILIENSLLGKQIENCVIGIGININQQEFKSNAPNPISLYQIVGHKLDREMILLDILERFYDYLKSIKNGKSNVIVSAYKQQLYRNDGFYPYRDSQGEFLAEIADIDLQGPILLRDQQGRLRQYAFKEVKYLITNHEL